MHQTHAAHYLLLRSLFAIGTLVTLTHPDILLVSADSSMLSAGRLLTVYIVSLRYRRKGKSSSNGRFECWTERYSRNEVRREIFTVGKCKIRSCCSIKILSCFDILCSKRLCAEMCFVVFSQQKKKRTNHDA